jgi:hypothetical protein
VYPELPILQNLIYVLIPLSTSQQVAHARLGTEADCGSDCTWSMRQVKVLPIGAMEEVDDGADKCEQDHGNCQKMDRNLATWRRNITY